LPGRRFARRHATPPKDPTQNFTAPEGCSIRRARARRARRIPRRATLSSPARSRKRAQRAIGRLVPRPRNGERSVSSSATIIAVSSLIAPVRARTTAALATLCTCGASRIPSWHLACSAGPGREPRGPHRRRRGETWRRLLGSRTGQPNSMIHCPRCEPPIPRGIAANRQRRSGGTRGRLRSLVAGVARRPG
jgi:hypothetical protein